jgi:hypothetical protein
MILIFLFVIAILLLGIYLRLGDVLHTLCEIEERTAEHIPTADEQRELTAPGAPCTGDEWAIWRSLR